MPRGAIFHGMKDLARYINMSGIKLIFDIHASSEFRPSEDSHYRGLCTINASAIPLTIEVGFHEH